MTGPRGGIVACFYQRWQRRVGDALCAALFCIVALGCSARAAERREVRVGDPLLADAEYDEDRGLWSSAPLSGGRWIPIGASGTVVVEHDLGHQPLGVQVYLSFTADDSDADTPRRFMPAAGNQAQVVRATDEVVEIFNNSAGEFYLRLLLQ